MTLRLSVFDDAVVPRSTIHSIELSAPWCISIPATDESFCCVIREGRCCLTTDDGKPPLPLGPGDVVTIVGGQPQMWRDSTSTAERPALKSFAAAAVLSQTEKSAPARSKVAVTRLLVMSAPRKSNRFVSVYPALVSIPASERGAHEVLDRLIQLIEIEHNANRPGKDAALRRLAELVVIELIRYALPRLPPGQSSWLAGLADPQVAQAISVMHRNPDRDWTLREISRQVGMSRASFVNRFRRLTGEPPHQHLRRVRLHMAASDLQKGDRSISQIAAAVGYRSESAFNRVFAQEFGVTPARYRRQHR